MFRASAAAITSNSNGRGSPLAAPDLEEGYWLAEALQLRLADCLELKSFAEQQLPNHITPALALARPSRRAWHDPKHNRHLVVSGAKHVGGKILPTEAAR